MIDGKPLAEARQCGAGPTLSLAFVPSVLLKVDFTLRIST
jgi:hypothetical protein